MPAEADDHHYSDPHYDFAATHHDRAAASDHHDRDYHDFVNDRHYYDGCTTAHSI